MIKKILLPLLPLFIHATLPAQVSVQLIPYATGLPNIVEVTHAGDDRLFCVLSGGTIRVIENDLVLPDAFLNITAQVTSGGEAGLLGLAFDPDYSENGYFYVHYNTNDPGLVSRISRFQVSTEDANVADPNSGSIIYQTTQPFSNHNGGDLKFGPDGYLYISLGDGGSGGDPQNNAQTLTNPLGALLRIDVHAGEGPYEIPADNPFATAGGDTVPEIFAYGLRNVWRFSFDALTGDLWMGDVGQNDWEEINFWANDENYNSGPNFGWRCYEGLAPYSLGGCPPVEELVFPVAVHSNPPWKSIIGGRVYRGSEFPSLYGHYLYTDYFSGQIWSLLPDGEGGWENEMLLGGLPGGMVTIGENNELELFVANRQNGTVLRLVDPTVSVKDPEELKLSIYPVPARDVLVVEGDLRGAGEMALFDAAGRKVAGRSVQASAMRAEFDVTKFANGTYVLVVNDRSGQELKRSLVSVMH